jgi:hypothetical protein
MLIDVAACSEEDDVVLIVHEYDLQLLVVVENLHELVLCELQARSALADPLQYFISVHLLGVGMIHDVSDFTDDLGCFIILLVFSLYL